MDMMNKEYSEEELQELIKNMYIDKGLSYTSVCQYALKMSQWVSYLDKKNLYRLIYYPEYSVEILEKTDRIKHTDSNHHIHISSVVAFIKHVMKDDEHTDLLRRWKEVERLNSDSITKHYDENKPSELQKDKVIDFNDINKIRKSLEKGTLERLLLSFYILIEPIRADYYATELIGSETEESKEENYIMMYSGTLIVKDFKTKKRYERIENVLSDELMNELKDSLEKYPRNYLFVMDDKKSPFTRKLFSNWACRTLKRVLKMPMTLTALRHIYITHKYKTNTSVVELIDIAKKMGHSRGMQRVYEWNPNQTRQDSNEEE